MRQDPETAELDARRRFGHGIHGGILAEIFTKFDSFSHADIGQTRQMVNRSRPPTRRSRWADRVQATQRRVWRSTLAAWSIPITASSPSHLHGELTRKVEHFRYRKARRLDEHRFQDDWSPSPTMSATGRMGGASSAKDARIFFKPPDATQTTPEQRSRKSAGRRQEGIATITG
jgi:hypothetical protein